MCDKGWKILSEWNMWDWHGLGEDRVVLFFIKKVFKNISKSLHLEPLKLSPSKSDLLLVSSLYYNDGWVG